MLLKTTREWGRSISCLCFLVKAFRNTYWAPLVIDEIWKSKVLHNAPCQGFFILCIHTKYHFFLMTEVKVLLRRMNCAIFLYFLFHASVKKYTFICYRQPRECWNVPMWWHFSWYWVFQDPTFIQSVNLKRKKAVFEVHLISKMVLVSPQVIISKNFSLACYQFTYLVRLFTRNKEKIPISPFANISITHLLLCGNVCLRFSVYPTTP